MSNRRFYKNGQIIIQQTDSYNDLADSTKPLINSVVLERNKTAQELNLMTADEIRQLIAQIRQVKKVNDYPATPEVNVLYYVGTTSPYNVCMYVQQDSYTSTLYAYHNSSYNQTYYIKNDTYGVIQPYYNASGDELGTISNWGSQYGVGDYVNISGKYYYKKAESDITETIPGGVERLDLGTTEVDISSKQDIVDNNLQTTSKNIVGAINENKANIDLKQNKADDNLLTTNKTIVSAINEIETDINNLPKIYAPLSSSYDINDSGAYNPDNLIFNMSVGNGYSANSNIAETRLFSNTAFTEPISNTRIYGITEVTEYLTEGNLYIEQVFTRKQWATSQQLYKFRRIGELKSQALTPPVIENYKGQITWRAWIPVEYPFTQCTPYVSASGTVTLGNETGFSISGGVMNITIHEFQNTNNLDSRAVINVCPNTIPVKQAQLYNTIQCVNTSPYDVAALQFLRESPINGIYVLRQYNVIVGTQYWGSMIVNLGY